MLVAVSEVKKAGYKIRYHVVGSGDEYGALMALVSELKIEDAVVFHGNRENPYPYIKGADLFVLPSHHEAAPMVFDEAACLGIPVLTTKTTSAYEMIIKENAGYVCENSQEGITGALLDILSHTEQLSSISCNLKKRSFNNCESVKVFKTIVD